MPKSSIQIKNAEIGEFVTPQNTAPIPMAAQREGEKPMSAPKALPKEAPIKKEGTISPPL